MCTRLVIDAGTPGALYDMHISQVLPKFASLFDKPEILSYAFDGFRRIETARERIKTMGVRLYTARFLVCTNEGTPIRTLVPVTSFTERGFDETGKVTTKSIERKGIATFTLMPSRQPQGASWYLITEAASHGLRDRHGNQRQPWLRQRDAV